MTGGKQDEKAARILEAMDRTPGWMYGFDIAKAAEFNSPSFYPTLARLEHDGWLESRWEAEWEDASKPRRRLYRVKPR